MSNTIGTSGSFLPLTTNTPLDARVIVDYEYNIQDIRRPYIGMIFYVKATGKHYVVKTLKSAIVNEMIMSNGAVGTYEPLVPDSVEFATDAEIAEMLRNLGLL